MVEDPAVGLTKVLSFAEAPAVAFFELPFVTSVKAARLRAPATVVLVEAATCSCRRTDEAKSARGVANDNKQTGAGGGGSQTKRQRCYSDVQDGAGPVQPIEGRTLMRYNRRALVS